MQLVQAHGADDNGFGDQQQRDWTRTATSAGLFLLWAGVLGECAGSVGCAHSAAVAPAEAAALICWSSCSGGQVIGY